MIQKPILIIGCPRSGTTLLFNILSEVPELWSIGYESKAIIERYHHPLVKYWESGSLVANDLTPVSRDYIISAFTQQAAPGTFWRQINHFREWLRGRLFWRGIKQKSKTRGFGSGISSAIPGRGLWAVRKFVQIRNTITLFSFRNPIRLLDKSPENCLRLPFLLELFPDARVIYLVRDGRPNIHSLMEGWRQPHIFPGYQVPENIFIPGDVRGRWAFTLIPGWRDLIASPLEEVCAWQWIRCNEAVLEHRERTQGIVPYLTVRYEDFVLSPSEVLHEIADFIDIDYALNFGAFTDGLPRINVVSDPDPEKWRKASGEAISRILPIIQPMMERLGY